MNNKGLVISDEGTPIVNLVNNTNDSENYNNYRNLYNGIFPQPK